MILKLCFYTNALQSFRKSTVYIEGKHFAVVLCSGTFLQRDTAHLKGLSDKFHETENLKYPRPLAANKRLKNWMKYVGKWRFHNLRTPLFKKERNLRTFTAPNGLQSLAINCNLVYATPGLGFKVYDWKKKEVLNPNPWIISVWLYIAYHSYVISVYISVCFFSCTISASAQPSTISLNATAPLFKARVSGRPRKENHSKSQEQISQHTSNLSVKSHRF